MVKDQLPAKDATTSERIAAHLRNAILAGEILPGSRIRQEEIAARFGASRLPVREALRMLETEGLTQLEANKSARVPTLDRSELSIVYEMRERIEPLALRLSLPHLTSQQESELYCIQEQIEEVEDDVARFLELDRRFHLETYAGCPKGELLTTVTRLWNSTQHFRRAFMLINGNDHHWFVNAEHRLILDAISRRDSEDCERYLAGHIRRTRILLTEHSELFPH
ncbi:GntR family transcriptional regulator [Mycolicibacterium chlorophenolicum]|uniref:Putative HTH-type transcriptional regulator YdfH n=2 Tax=Mycolicibacterium chlorophenolicum TaxID=37916 RepID=A0A0J6WPL9_9MYCO|nr:GntR family transcriptional regulator [Mycolicibacterium chlorophenolicum]KMO83647.1 putative HTH-type transcriptional regulator YdfH [Mycolicibacterium chlorophenolicum]